MGLKLLAPSPVINYWSQRTVTPALRSGMTPVQRSTAINAAAADAAGKTLLLPSAAIDSALQFGGVREVRGYGGGRATLDFSGRSSYGTLLRASGTLSATTHALTSDAGPTAGPALDPAVGNNEIKISSAAAATYPAGSVVKITSAALEYPGAEIAYGERVEIVATQTTGDTTTLTLSLPLTLDYLVSDSAVIALLTEQNEIEVSGIDIIGTGNDYVSPSPLNSEGDHGFVFDYCKRALIGDCRAYYAERNAFRFNDCKDFFSENNYALFNEAVTTAQIKYGHVVIGSLDEGRIRNCRAEGEFRHAIDGHGGGPGLVKHIMTEGCIAEGGYDEAYSQHDLVARWTSKDDTARKCGGGFGLRSKFELVRPTIEDCYNAIGGAAFSIVDVAEGSIHDPTVRNVRYIAASRNETGNKNFKDNTAPVRVSVHGGNYSAFTNGWYFSQLGVANTVLAGYTTRKIGSLEFHGGNYLCTGPREAPTISIRPISVEGYCEELIVDGTSISYDDTGTTPYRAVVALGVDRTIISGPNKWTKTQGLLHGSKGDMLDGAGSVHIQLALSLDVLREPIIVDHVADYEAINSSSHPDVTHVSRSVEVKRLHEVDGPTSFTLPAAYMIDSIFIRNTVASGVSGGINIGTTLGGIDIVNGYSVGGLSNFLVADGSIALRFISGTVDQTIYIDADTSFNDAILEMSFVCKKVL